MTLYNYPTNDTKTGFPAKGKPVFFGEIYQQLKLLALLHYYFC